MFGLVFLARMKKDQVERGGGGTQGWFYVTVGSFDSRGTVAAGST